MIRALIHLALRTTQNRILRKLRRLRQPRYLITLLLGLAYFAWFFFRVGGPGPREDHEVSGTGGIYLIALTGVAWLGMLAAWAFPSDNAGIEFSETEVQFLFPAPLQRWQLLLYKVLHPVPGFLFIAIIFRLLILHSCRVFGIWLALIVLNVYLMMVSLARARLRLMGMGFTSRLVGVLILFVATMLLLLHSFGPTGFRAVLESFRTWHSAAAVQALEEKLFTWPVGAMLWIPSLLVRPAVSGSFSLACAWSAGLLVLGVLFFGIATRLDVSFEDASIVKSRKLAQRLENQRLQRSGQRVFLKRLPPPFRLAEQGPAEIAIFWKNLISAGRITLPILLGIVLFLLTCAAVLSFTAGRQAALQTVSAFSLTGLAVMAGLGPHLFRNDLRRDLEQIDVLKVLPVSGTRMVLSQVMSSTVIVLGFQLVFLAIALGFGLFLVPAAKWLRYVHWMPVALVAMFLIDLVQVTFRNAIVILFPGWATLTHGPGNGLEAIGQGTLFMVGNLLVVAAIFLPISLLFIVTFGLANVLIGAGPASVTIAVLLATAALCVEMVLVLRFLGRQFDRIDIANDLQGGTKGN